MNTDIINESLAEDILKYEELKEGIFSTIGEIGAGLKGSIGGIFDNIKTNFKDARRNKAIENFKNEMLKAMQADNSKVQNALDTLGSTLDKRSSDLEQVKQNIIKKSANDPQLQQALKTAMDQHTQEINRFKKSLDTFKKSFSNSPKAIPQTTPAPTAKPAPKKVTNKKPQAPKVPPAAPTQPPAAPVAPKQPNPVPTAPQVAPKQPQATPAPKAPKKSTKKKPLPETKKQILENSKLMLSNVNKIIKDKK